MKVYELRTGINDCDGHPILTFFRLFTHNPDYSDVFKIAKDEAEFLISGDPFGYTRLKIFEHVDKKKENITKFLNNDIGYKKYYQEDEPNSEFFLVVSTKKIIDNKKETPNA